MTTAPLSWIKRVSSEIPELRQVPLFGNAPGFDWKHLSSQLTSRFGVSGVTLSLKACRFQDAANASKGLGTNFLTIPVYLAPLGPLYWMMSEMDFIKLTSFMMKPSNGTSLTSEILQEGFYRFLILEALSVIQAMPPFANLTLQLSEEEIPHEGGFCLDIEIGLNEKTCFGRLVIPREFRSQWVQHFSQTPSEYISTETAQRTYLTIGIKTGSVLIHQDEFKSIRPGDFVLLDKGSYDAHKGTGICMVMLQSTPLFNAKIKQNKIELIDYAFYYEENMEQSSETPELASETVQKLPAEEGETVALKELPLYITVEIARFKMTLDQLMHLTPGNTLELPIHPDQGVSLTVNGQKVGRAELIYLGEQLGLRILEI